MLPTTADVVIIGGGCMGASIAYHLAQRQAGKIVLLEREKFLAMGSTGRNAGGVRYQFSTPVNIQLSLYSLDIIARFEELFGVSASYHPIGYLFLLSEPEHVEHFKQNIALQQSLGVKWVRFLNIADIAQLIPLVNLEGIIGGSICTRDGTADPYTVTQTYATEAKRRGVQIETETNVVGIETHGGRVSNVITGKGKVETRVVVNCAGPWASKIGAMVGLDIPIVPLRRQFFNTDEIPEISRDHPFVIEFSTSLYFHPDTPGLLVGMSNHHEKPSESYAIDEEFHWETLERAIYRLPLLENARVVRQLAGLYEVTPDAHPIFGQSCDIPGFYICAGFSGHGFQHSPGAGKVMSEIILDGAPKTVDVSMLDLERFRDGRPVVEQNVV
ncbi:MAG TPA: FAD-binding oxidoreductase [Anaerolineae bacterium]|nr:FAD-binding oxidoreductase [Anaerolineae bacterium]